MDLTPWKLGFIPAWDKHFSKFDEPTRERILKKLEQMKQALLFRGFHSSKYHVEEAGQFRIAFKQDEETRTKYIQFIGNHKHYEKWYRER